MPKRLTAREAKRQIRYASDPISKFQELVFPNPHLKGKVRIPRFYERGKAPELSQKFKRDMKRGFVDSFIRRKAAGKYLKKRMEREIERYRGQVKFDFNAIGNFLLRDIPAGIRSRLISEALGIVKFTDTSDYDEGSDYNRHFKAKSNGPDKMVGHELRLSLRHSSGGDAAHEFMHFFRDYLQERLGRNYFEGVNSHVIASAMGLYFQSLYQARSGRINFKSIVREKVFHEASRIAEKELGMKLEQMPDFNKLPVEIQERAILNVATEELKSSEDKVFHLADIRERYDEGGEYLGVMAAFIETTTGKPWLGLAIIENLMKGKNPEQVFKEAEEGKYDKKIRLFLREFKPPYMQH